MRIRESTQKPGAPLPHGTCHRVPVVRRLVAATCLACAGLWATVPAAWAGIQQPPPDICQAISVPGPAQEAGPALVARIQALSIHVQECQNHAGFLATLGHLLNRQGDPVEAIGHLERSLLIEPDSPGAKLDFAISLALTGDVQAAVGLVDDLLTRLDVPELLRPELQRQRAQWVDGAWTRRTVLGLRLGRDSNVLGAPNLSSLTLTLPDQNLQLPLADNFKDQAATFALVNAQMELRRTALDGSYWDLLLAGRTRSSPAVAEAGSTQLDAAVERGLNLWGAGAAGFNGLYGLASWSDLRTRNGVQYRVTGVGGGWLRRPRQQCQTRLGLEHQSRRYLSNELLSGSYSGVSAGLLCEGDGGRQWQLSGRWGTDQQTDALRPGGAQKQAALRGVLYQPLRPYLDALGALVLDVELSQTHDDTAYSSFLDNGRPRNTQRQQFRVEYQRALGRQWQWLAGLEVIRQRSNLELFQLRNTSPYVAVRYGF